MKNEKEVHYQRLKTQEAWILEESKRNTQIWSESHITSDMIDRNSTDYCYSSFDDFSDYEGHFGKQAEITTSPKLLEQ